MQLPQPDAASFQPNIQGVLWDIGRNTVIPVLLYYLSKRFVSPSEFTALAVATSFPILESGYDLLRHRRLDPIALVVLGGIVVDAVAILFGGSPRLLLIRESFFTGAFGALCFLSLFFRRPLMFYFGRHFMAGNDPVKQARFDASWRIPEVRFGNRLITLVWGIVFVGELVIRITLVYSLPPALVLVFSPIILGLLTVAALVWTFRYAGQTRERTLNLLR